MRIVHINMRNFWATRSQCLYINEIPIIYSQDWQHGCAFHLVSPWLAWARYIFYSLWYMRCSTRNPWRPKRAPSSPPRIKPLENIDTNKQCHLATEFGAESSERDSIEREVKLLSKYFCVIYYMGASEFLTQFSLTAILSTLTFKSSPFRPRDHYQYYRFLNDLGQMIGGMELSLVSFFCPGFLDIIKIRRIWILVLLSAGHMMVFISVSWFHFTDNVYIIFILCFTQGVTTGCATVQCFSLTADLFIDSRKLGTVLGYLEVSATVGKLSAGLLGVFVEKYLTEHCTHRLLLGRFCLARLPSLKMWTTSNCKKWLSVTVKSSLFLRIIVKYSVMKPRLDDKK